MRCSSRSNRPYARRTSRARGPARPSEASERCRGSALHELRPAHPLLEMPHLQRLEPVPDRGMAATQPHGHPTRRLLRALRRHVHALSAPRDPPGRGRPRSPRESRRGLRYLPSRRNRPRTRRTTPIPGLNRRIHPELNGRGMSASGQSVRPAGRNARRIDRPRDTETSESSDA